MPAKQQQTNPHEARLAELQRLGLLNTSPEESFDRVTRLAARTLRVPIALVSLVDDTREWFKSRLGLDVTHIPLDSSFCAHVVRERRALAIHDTTADPRLAANPLVTGAPFVRSCLGIPLYNGKGQPVGALCAMDTQERHFDAAEVATWSDFAGIVQGMIHARELAAETDRLLRMTEASEQKHLEIERRLQKVANSMPALLGYWNTDLRCEFANDGYRAYFGLSPEQMIGMHMRDLIGEKLFELNGPHALGALAGEHQRFQRRVTRRDGRTLDTDGQYLPDRDEAGNVRGFYVLVTDISELSAAKSELELSNAKLLKESTTDFLTGLANRRVFTEKCDAAFVRFRDGGEGFGLILLDLDDFKQINDCLGHETGDDVLRQVGKILANQLRDSEDLAARLGGEELAVLCPGNFTEGSLYDLASRIRAQINQTVIETPRGQVSSTSSFGIASSNDDDISWASSFARADSALYEAKKSGKDRIVFGHSPSQGATGRFRSLGITVAR